MRRHCINNYRNLALCLLSLCASSRVADEFSFKLQRVLFV